MTDIVSRLLQRIAQLGRDAVPRRLHLLFCDAQRLAFAQAIPLLGISAQRLISALAYVGDHLARDWLCLGSIHRAAMDKLRDDSGSLLGFDNFHLTSPACS